MVFHHKGPVADVLICLSEQGADQTLMLLMILDDLTVMYIVYKYNPNQFMINVLRHR